MRKKSRFISYTMEDVEMKDVQMKDLEMKDMEMKDVEMKDMEMKDAEMKDAEMNVAHPFNSLICELLFPYLERKDLLAASLVCKTWNRMAFDKLLVSVKSIYLLGFCAI